MSPEPKICQSAIAKNYAVNKHVQQIAASSRFIKTSLELFHKLVCVYIRMRVIGLNNY